MSPLSIPTFCKISQVVHHLSIACIQQLICTVNWNQRQASIMKVMLRPEEMGKKTHSFRFSKPLGWSVGGAKMLETDYVIISKLASS